MVGSGAHVATARLPHPERSWRRLRELHHSPFPATPGLLARQFGRDARGLTITHLFRDRDSAVAAGCPLARLVPAARLPAPILVVAPPRSGGTALFDALTRHPDLWSLGHESEGVIEGVPALHPASGGYRTHALAADLADAYQDVVRAGFLAGLRDARRRRWLDLEPGQRPVAPRLVEKTPENALRLPFLLRVFPDAAVVFLRRDPRDTIASMVRAWQHPGFLNIPDLPGWPPGGWHLLLPGGWRRLRAAAVSAVATAQWEAATEAILAAAPRLVQVEYAELRAAPRRVLSELYAALGLTTATAPGELPLSATTISPPRPGKWRHTTGFDPTALAAAAPTMHKLAQRRSAMPLTRSAPRTRVRFACWLADATDPVPSDVDGMVVDPDVVLQGGTTVPLGLAVRTRFRERFLPDYPILWVSHRPTGTLRPFWARREDLWRLRELRPGSPVPAGLPVPLCSALAAAGALADPAAAAKVPPDHATGAGELARIGVCRIDDVLHPAQQGALDRYYEQLIATGTWRLGDAQVAGRYGWHNEPLSRFFHHQLTGLIGRLAGRPVRPAYSYASAYRGGAVLDRHLDREQCDYTVSLLVSESGPGVAGGWPLHFDTTAGTVTVIQQPGQAVLFRGTRLPHYRPSLPEGSTHTSLLFHYVAAEFRRTLY